MENTQRELEAVQIASVNTKTPGFDWFGIEFRPDLAFPHLTEQMVERLKVYGSEETVPANTALYAQGDREIDMFVVLEGGVDVFLPTLNGESKIYGQHRKLDFTGEFNLLNNQRSLVEAHTVDESRLLRISRKQLQHLMRVEGDISNLIVQAATWRRIGILKAVSS